MSEESTKHQIDVQHASESVRQRPDMYRWRADKVGLHELFWETVDEFSSAPDCDSIQLDFMSPSDVTVIANGFGFSTELLQPGRFEAAMGLFSSRTSIFNTLCELFDIKFFHQDHYYSFEYDSGALVSSFYGGDSAEYLDSVEHEETDADSSEVRIKFDKNIFKDCSFDYDWINQEIRDRATRSDIEIIVKEHKPKPDTRLKEKPPHDNWDVPAEWQEIWSQLEFDEFSHYLVAWKPTKRRMIGGLRLILPKNGKQSFFVSSGECASERWGVSAYYEMKFKIAGNPILISKIVSEFTGLSPVAIYKLAKNLGTSDVVYIGEPVEMLNRVKTEGGTIELYRPDDKGGYF